MHFFTQINDEQYFQLICTMVMVTGDQVQEEGKRKGLYNE